jgi:hypothetical protein
LDDATPGANSSQHEQTLQWKYTALQRLDAQTQIGATIDTMRLRMADIRSNATDLETTVGQVQSSLEALPQLGLGLRQRVLIALEAVTCGPLGGDVDVIENYLCESILQPLGVVTLGFLSAAVGAACAVPAAIVAVKRLPNPTTPPSPSSHSLPHQSTTPIR